MSKVRSLYTSYTIGSIFGIELEKIEKAQVMEYLK